MPRTRLSELEAYVLGLLFQHGPRTAHFLRRCVADSPSTQWSASAGAIYPLVSRLRRSGLIAARAGATGRRPRAELRLTPKGAAALRGWIGPPMDPLTITVSHDPLRSRARFLEILPPKARLRWIAAAESALDAAERRVIEFSRATRGAPGFTLSEAILTRSGELDLASRRQWLKDVRSLLARHKTKRVRRRPPSR